MKRLIPLFSLLLCLSALGVNITNYPLTNNYSGNELFLLSSIPWKTNFNLPGNYVAKTSDLNSASNSILAQMPTTNGFVDASVTNGLQGALINPLTNGHSVSVTISNALTVNTSLVFQASTSYVTNGTGGKYISLNANGIGIGKTASSSIALDVTGAATISSTLTAGGEYSYDYWLSNPANRPVLQGSGGSLLIGNSSGWTSLSLRPQAIESLSVTTNGIITPGTLTATNGIVTQRMPCTSNAVTVVAGQQIYCVNGTNQLITLPAANVTWVTNIIYRFTSTNGWGSFIITNGTGAQSIRDGTSLSLTNIGIGEISLFSDGAAWWLASKARTILPSASWSSATTITPVQDVITNIPWTDLEFNNSQGLTLRTNATFARPTELWITNAGTYMITFSAVLKGSGGGTVISLWLRENGSDVVRTRTDQGFTGATAQQCMTVNYFVNVGTAPKFYELVAASHDASPPTIVGATANPTGYTAPAMPAVIVTINRVSDPWP